VMAKWSVYGAIYATKFLGTFEAETAEQAEQIAMEQNGGVSICHQCSGEISDPDIDHCIVELDTP
jgi:hypothetical protein